MNAVATTGLLPATASQLWERLRFYEQIERRPTWLLRLALPMPARVVGDPRAVGALSRCEYADGEFLLKRTTRAVPGAALDFEVLDCSARLSRHLLVRGGTIELAPAGPGRTRVRMETRYEPRGACFALRRPAATRIIRALHRIVMADMAGIEAT